MATSASCKCQPVDHLNITLMAEENPFMAQLGDQTVNNSSPLRESVGISEGAIFCDKSGAH